MNQQKLKTLVRYEPTTGMFYWAYSNPPYRKAGAVAGYVRSDGYARIEFNGRPYYSHRLAWMYVYGDDLPKLIDHINRNPSDNRISNLRAGSKSINSQNTTLRADNKSGKKGVHFSTKRKRWIAQIVSDGKHKYLGAYKCKEAAFDAYQAAAARLHTANTVNSEVQA